jgi:DNA-binding NtrC family response regulator
MNLPGKIRISIVEDDIIHYKLMRQQLDEEKFEISWFQSGRTFLNSLGPAPDIITLDHGLPDISGLEVLKELQSKAVNSHIIFFSGQMDLSVVVETYRLGSKHYIIKDERGFSEFKSVIQNIEQLILLKRDGGTGKELTFDRSKYSKIIGESPEIYKVLKLIQKVESSDFLTLITGESGTGKELVAYALHENSPRKKKPFIPVNISAIPSELVESELFGHEKGAFTGADSKRIGKFEEADGGTIFLDEIGEIDMSLQTKLLRVLQEKKITRLGSNKEIPVDIRVVLATNRFLGAMVREGKFREDLYFRIQGFLIHLPPLRDRGMDVIILARYFIKAFCADNKIKEKRLTDASVQMLLNHKWPGNIRELKAVTERAVLISETDELTTDDIIFSEY